jgi:hypothetical protein
MSLPKAEVDEIILSYPPFSTTALTVYDIISPYLIFPIINRSINRYGFRSSGALVVIIFVIWGYFFTSSACFLTASSSPWTNTSI